MLLLTGFCAVGLAVWIRQSRVRAVVNRLQQQGAQIKFKMGGPDWFHQSTHHFFDTVVMVDASRCDLAPGDLEDIEKLHGLKRLYLTRTDISDDDVVSLSGCEHLQRLSLYGCRNLSKRCIEPLAQLTHLQVLDLHDTRIPPAALAGLGKLPNLTQLVFSPRFYQPPEDAFHQDAFAPLESVPDLQPVGKCFLYGFSADQVDRFLGGDLSRVAELIFRECDYSDQSLARLGSEHLSSIDLQLEDIDSRQLELIDGRNIQQADISGAKDSVSLEQFASWLPEGVQVAFLGEDNASFHYGSTGRWRFRLHDEDPALTEHALNALVEKGLVRLVLGGSDHVQANLESVIRVNPAIRVRLHAEGIRWPQLARATRLRWLDILSCEDAGLQFDRMMELEGLTIRFARSVQTTRETYAQIAKLEHLRSLHVQTANPVGLQEVQPLAELSKLNKLRIENADAEARAFLDSIVNRNQ
ncbi:hypothetical protein FYK55_27755 [Roseiconus nitratireducens]|uniref:Leucine Rich repeats (2 copies) n=1 Tax=Roseiconus nitratireducens TaxID=2605748 RepID=A0A5M6CSU5_9BACT|nr:hypothetical protein [Roseiconus nitratireducens]KAA5538016.1 hypothetical protein FYK55_27755 [Roseiconus nitratireducens]